MSAAQTKLEAGQEGSQAVKAPSPTRKGLTSYLKLRRARSWHRGQPACTLGHQRHREGRQCLISAQVPEATSPKLLLMPRGGQLGLRLGAAGICVPREQWREAGPTQEALKPHFKQIPQQPPPLETQQHLPCPLPQLLPAGASCGPVQQTPLSCMEGPGPRGRHRDGGPEGVGVQRKLLQGSRRDSGLGHRAVR